MWAKGHYLFWMAWTLICFQLQLENIKPNCCPSCCQREVKAVWTTARFLAQADLTVPICKCLEGEMKRTNIQRLGSLTSLYNLLSKQGNHYRGSQIWPSLDIVSISVHTNTGKKITNNKETIMEEELFFQQRVEATAKMVPSPLLWQSNSHPRNWKREERPPHTY